MSDNSSDTGDQFILESEADRERTPVGEEMRVGRDPKCELELSSEKSSRVHAKLNVEDGVLWVEDQKSTNGTYVNKKKISERTKLDNGDVVQFGDVRFRVIAPEPAQDEPDDQGTVMFGEQTMLHSVDSEEEAAPAPAKEEAKPKAKATANKEPKKDKEEKPGKAAEKQAPPKEKESAKQAKAAPSDKTGGGKPAGSDAGSASIPGRGEGSSSIPASWADADQLEQASHTAFVARAPSKEKEAAGLQPDKAIAQARQSIGADEPILVGLTPPVEGKPFKLRSKGGMEKWEMGRGKGADISLDDESVSGRHAQLICEHGRWKVVNMMSVNGTFVNERKVLSAYLNPRDVIRMGTVELVFDARLTKHSEKPAAKASGSGEASSGGSVMDGAMRGLRRAWQTLLGLFGKK